MKKIYQMNQTEDGTTCHAMLHINRWRGRSIGLFRDRMRRFVQKNRQLFTEIVWHIWHSCELKHTNPDPSERGGQNMFVERSFFDRSSSIFYSSAFFRFFALWLCGVFRFLSCFRFLRSANQRKHYTDDKFGRAAPLNNLT